MRYYDIIADSYDNLHGEEQRKKFRIISKNLKLDEYSYILDVGCGTGICSIWPNFSVGVDPSIGLLKEARKKGKRFIQAGAENLPFKDHSFDVVMSVTAIHLFDDVDRALNEMKRVGKERFIFSILKRSSRSEEIIKKIRLNFKVKKRIDEERDVILFV